MRLITILQCSAVQCSAVQCSAVVVSAVQCVQCSAVQCIIVQCSAVQCSAKQLSSPRQPFQCLLYARFVKVISSTATSLQQQELSNNFKKFSYFFLFSFMW